MSAHRRRVWRSGNVGWDRRKLLGGGCFSRIGAGRRLPAPAQASLSFSARSTVRPQRREPIARCGVPWQASAPPSMKPDSRSRSTRHLPGRRHRPRSTATSTCSVCPVPPRPSARPSTAAGVRTFNPTSPGTPTAIAIGGGSGLSGVACPSTTTVHRCRRQRVSSHVRPDFAGHPDRDRDRRHHPQSGRCGMSLDDSVHRRRLTGHEVTFRTPTSPGTPTRPRSTNRTP